MSTKVLAKEYKQLTIKDPLPGIGIELPDEDNLTVWDVSVQIDISGTIIEFLVRIQFHETDYPAKAPVVGFAVPFGYQDLDHGAEFVQTGDGPLSGGVCICNSAFGGFFRAVHDDWAASGTGYSPAGGFKSVVLNIQSILTDVISELDISSRNLLIKRLQKFKDAKIWTIPDIPISIDNKSTNDLADDLPVDLIDGVLETNITSLSVNNIMQVLCEEKKAQLLKLLTKHFSPLPDLVCWYNHNELAIDNEEIFGYLLNCQKNPHNNNMNITTDGYITSYSAYTSMHKSNNIVTVSNVPATHFIPIFVHNDHYKRDQWQQCLRIHLTSIMTNKSLTDACIYVFSSLINTLLVEMFQSHTDKTASCRTFQALLNIWRTFYQIVFSIPDVQNTIIKKLDNFINNENERHKSNTPDIGHLMVLASLFSYKDNMFKAIFYETMLRTMMWNHRKGCNINNVQAVFQVTKITRNIVFFHRLFHEIIVGNKSMEDSIKNLDKTCCECPELMEKMMVKWKLYNDKISHWNSYLNIIRYPENSKFEILDTSQKYNWFQKLSYKASQLRGYHDTRSR